MNKEKTQLEEVKDYWKGKNVPQQWYSEREPYTLQWFNEISYKRYKLYYTYLVEGAEFAYHGNEKVLEVGCGIGTDLIEYAKYGANVSGVDLGPDQVMLTKINFKLRGLPYETIQEGNAESLPFDDESFDLVYSFGVLHHTPDTKKAVNEIYRVLKKDGKAIVMVYARGWKHYIKRCLFQGLFRGRWLANSFDWKKVYNEISEVHGNSPKTDIYSNKQVRELFNNFKYLEVKKKRLGEFFEYPPYNTYVFPSIVRKVCYFLGLELLIGENWLVKAQKFTVKKETKLWEVLFKHY
ncbi:MAG: methyltransferase domain-containing protein [Candidatus Omnitrophica bacterium]|nr:methyltransferase domain-containing protein [Candidatus Omnitrophota bacterium]